MKTILRTLPTNLEMRYDLKFSSEENAEILRKVILNLVNALKRFKTTYQQVREWLSALHRHR